VLESIIVKNKIENILPGKQEIDDLIDEAVFAVRAEEKHSNGTVAGALDNKIICDYHQSSGKYKMEL